MKTAPFLATALLGLAVTARAEVQEATADHFVLGFSADVAASPAKTYAAIGLVQHWWNAEHTWSGDAANLSLKPEAGGCFCERWKDGSTEHGRVIMARRNELLRLDSALGPLQERALNGVLSFQLGAGENGTTQLNVDYRVNGSSASGLDKLAAAVDQVLGMQVDRLLRYIDTGNPEPDVAADAGEPPSRRQARAELLEQWARQAAAEQAKDTRPLKPDPAPKPRSDR